MKKKSDLTKWHRQQLVDLEHLLSKDVSEYLVFLKEGSKDQAEKAKLKARTNLLKFGPEMQMIAEKMGDVFTDSVDNYLDSIDEIVHNPASMVDDAKISYCFQMLDILEKNLKAA